MQDKALIDQLTAALCASYGALDLVSAWMPFDYTTYYEPEMGAHLVRRMLAFKTLVRQDDLPAIKLKTNRLEAQYSKDSRRRVNIDPGYLLLERLVLASGKNFSHRIYLDDGIYADLTLVYQHGAFKKLPWTYPDYADQPMLEFLQQVRRKYAIDLKQTG
jgi:hypothetical protein